MKLRRGVAADRRGSKRLGGGIDFIPPEIQVRSDLDDLHHAGLFVRITDRSDELQWCGALAISFIGFGNHAATGGPAAECGESLEIEAGVGQTHRLCLEWSGREDQEPGNVRGEYGFPVCFHRRNLVEFGLEMINP
jgi:hypothetical protein